MAEVIVLHAPKDRVLARSAIGRLTELRALLVPLTPRARNYQLGARMLRVVIWSAHAAEAGVAGLVTEFQSGGAPMMLALCDDTPVPEALMQAARATIAVGGDAVSQAKFANLAQSLSDAEWRAPAVVANKSSMRRNLLLAAVVAGIVALGVVAGVSAWGPHFAGAQGSE